jgi:hypothetical protein
MVRGGAETNLLLDAFLLLVAERLKSIVEVGEDISSLFKIPSFKGGR